MSEKNGLIRYDREVIFTMGHEWGKHVTHVLITEARKVKGSGFIGLRTKCYVPTKASLARLGRLLKGKKQTVKITTKHIDVMIPWEEEISSYDSIGGVLW